MKLAISDTKNYSRFGQFFLCVIARRRNDEEATPQYKSAKLGDIADQDFFIEMSSH